MSLDDFNSEHQSTEVHGGEVKYKDEDWLTDKIEHEELSPNEIGDMFNVDGATIRYWIDKFGISPFQEQQMSIGLTQYEKSVVEGSLLGDGSIPKTEFGNERFTVSNNKIAYLKYIRNQLNDELFNDGWLSNRKDRNTANGELKTKCTSEFTQLRDDWYDETKKLPEQFTLDTVNLKHWYIQDGSVTNENRNPVISICWPTEDEVERLVKEVKNLIGDASLYENNRGEYTIYIPSDYVDSFFGMIGSCPVDSYKYKWIRK